MPLVAREVRLHAPVVAVGVFDFDDRPPVAGDLPVCGPDGADVPEFEGDGLAPGQPEDDSVLPETKLTLRPRGVLLDDAADDRGVSDEDHLVLEGGPAVLRLEVLDVPDVHEDDVVADLQRCRVAAGVAGQFLAVVGDPDLGVGDGLLAAVGREDEPLAGQHHAAGLPVALDGLAVPDGVPVVSRGVDEPLLSLAHAGSSGDSGPNLYKLTTARQVTGGRASDARLTGF